MASAVVQTKAIILICLLTGQEIHSLRERLVLFEEESQIANGNRDDHLRGPETSIRKKLDSKCSSEGDCVGEGCKPRPLPLDKSPSDACRLSTMYMVNSPPEEFKEYVDLNTELLKQKTSSFQSECVNGGGSLRMIGVCNRRMWQMLQANTFLEAAQQKLSKLPADQHAEARSKMKGVTVEAGKKLSDLFGDDAALVMSFLQKVKLHPTLLGDNLRDVTLYIMTTIGNLLDGTDEEKENARAEILQVSQNLPSSNPSADEVAKMDVAFKGMGFNQSDDDWAKTEDKISEVTGGTTETSSLLDLQEWTQACPKGRRTVFWFFVLFFFSLAVIIDLILIWDMLLDGPIWRWTRCKDYGGKGGKGGKGQPERVGQGIGSIGGQGTGSISRRSGSLGRPRLSDYGYNDGAQYQRPSQLAQGGNSPEQAELDHILAQLDGTKTTKLEMNPAKVAALEARVEELIAIIASRGGQAAQDAYQTKPAPEAFGDPNFRAYIASQERTRY